MRIIKPGSDPQPNYRAICSRCGAEVEYVRSEAIGTRRSLSVEWDTPVFRCPTEWCRAELVGAKMPDRNREAVAA